MSHRTSALIGRPIVSADDGARLGTVADVLLDDRGERVVGLIVRHGLLRSEGVLPATAVQTLGGDAVITRSSGDLVPGSEWRSREGADRDGSTRP
jgi:uncharacterized protein YrrD